MACPEPDVLARFSQGLLVGSELEAFEAHLAGCADCLREIGAIASGDGDGAPSAELGLLRRGENVGRYLVLQLLGAGGMGLVYDGYDPLLERKVAIKLLRPRPSELERSGPGASRLLGEAQALARLSHPNVVAIYDVGLVGEQVFIALERVDGVSLTHWLKQPRHWRQIRDAFVSAGLGLAAAHAAGLVHRDFKPDNVLAGADGRVRVTDFGLARAQPEPNEPLAGPEALAKAGTPGFIAPEVLDGHGADARSDQFSFCVALKQALDAPSRLGRPPPWLRRAVERGTRERPEDRFPSIDALLDALTFDPVRKAMPWAATAAVVLFAAVAWFATRSTAQSCSDSAARIAPAWNPTRATTVKQALQATQVPYWLEAWTTTERVLDAYARSWAAMRTDACEATQLRHEQSGEALDLRMACLDRAARDVDQLVALLEHADAKVVENAPLAAQALPSLSACADVQGLRRTQRPPEDPAARARLEELRSKLAEASALTAVGKPKEGLGRATPLLPVVNALGYAPAQAEVSFALGDAAFDAQDYAAARTHLHEAAIFAETGADLRLEARCYARLAMVAGPVQRQFDEGALFNRHARALLDRIGRDPELEAELLDVDAQLTYLAGHLDDSLALSRRALAALEQAGLSDARRASALRSFIGFVLADLGQLDEAVQFEERALNDRRTQLGSKHPEVARSLTNLALVHSKLGADERALAEFEEASAIWTAALGASSPNTGFAGQGAADALMHLGRLDEAERTGAESLETLRKGYGPSHPRVGSALATLGQIALARGELELAQQRYQQALEIFDGPGSNPTRKGLPLAGLGEVLLARDEPKQALDPLEKAVALLDQLEGNDDDHAEAHFALARALFDSGGDRTRAIALAQRAHEEAARLPKQRSPRREIDAWLDAHPSIGSPR